MLHCTYCGYIPQERCERLNVTMVDGEQKLLCDCCSLETKDSYPSYEWRGENHKRINKNESNKADTGT